MKHQIENAVNDGVRPRPRYEFEVISREDKLLLLLRVFQGDHTPYAVGNRTFRRMDTSTVEVDRIAHKELILNGRNMSYTDVEVDERKLSFTFLERELCKHLGIEALTEDLLISLGLKKPDTYTVASALFADNHDLREPVIQLIAYADDSVREIIDHRTLSGISLLEGYDRCIDFYYKHFNIAAHIESFYRETFEEMPLRAFREAVANAIVHRDYAREVAVRIEIFSDRVEIVLPGGLPIGMTERDFQEGRYTVLRNRVVAEIFQRVGIIEKLGTGIRRIRECFSGNDRTPEFSASENSVKIVMYRRDRKARRGGSVSEQAGKYALFDHKYSIVTDYVEKHMLISRKEAEDLLGLKKTQVAKILSNMVSDGILEQVGQGRSIRYISRVL